MLSLIHIWIQPPSSGPFTFFVTADDGLRLWIDGELVIDFWSDQGYIERTGTARLQADHKHDIRLEYYAVSYTHLDVYKRQV